MAKFTCTVIQCDNGKYRANMIINGRDVLGLPYDVDYRTLRDGIQRMTGIQILKRKDMIFEKLSDFEKIATIDATQPLPNGCRVTLEDRKSGWNPDWSKCEY